MKIGNEYKWLARDKDGGLWAFSEKPKRIEWCSHWNNTKRSSFEEVEEDVYPFIKWEDEPWTVTEAQYFLENKEGYSFWEVLQTLEEYDYPDGATIMSVDGDVVFEVRHKEETITIRDVYGYLVDLCTVNLKGRYLNPEYSKVKEISKQEIMEKFDCDEFKIVD